MNRFTRYQLPHYNPYIQTPYPPPIHNKNQSSKISNIETSKKENEQSNKKEENLSTIKELKNSKSNINLRNNIPANPSVLKIGTLEIHNDELLILALIYLLYKENITDKLLLLALFSLLF